MRSLTQQQQNHEKWRIWSCQDGGYLSVRLEGLLADFTKAVKMFVVCKWTVSFLRSKPAIRIERFLIGLLSLDFMIDLLRSQFIQILTQVRAALTLFKSHCISWRFKQLAIVRIAKKCPLMNFTRPITFQLKLLIVSIFFSFKYSDIWYHQINNVLIFFSLQIHQN